MVADRCRHCRKIGCTLTSVSSASRRTCFERRSVERHCSARCRRVSERSLARCERQSHNVIARCASTEQQSRRSQRFGVARPKRRHRSLQDCSLRVSQQISVARIPTARIILRSLSTGPLLREYADPSGHCDRRLPAIWSVLLGGADRLSRLGRISRAPSSDNQALWRTSNVSALGGRRGALSIRRERLGASESAHGYAAARLGSSGVAVSQMGNSAGTLYTGELFDNNVAVIVPTHAADLAGDLGVLLSRTSSTTTVRRIDPKIERDERDAR